MILALNVQYNYNGTVTIAEPCPTQFFDYVEIVTAKTLEEAKQKACEYYGTEYKLVFVDDEGDEL